MFPVKLSPQFALQCTSVHSGAHWFVDWWRLNGPRNRSGGLWLPCPWFGFGVHQKHTAMRMNQLERACLSRSAMAFRCSWDSFMGLEIAMRSLMVIFTPIQDFLGFRFRRRCLRIQRVLPHLWDLHTSSPGIQSLFLRSWSSGQRLALQVLNRGQLWGDFMGSPYSGFPPCPARSGVLSRSASNRFSAILIYSGFNSMPR